MPGSLFEALNIELPKFPGRRKAGLMFRPEFQRPLDWQPYDALPELEGVVFLDLENKDRGLGEGKGSSWYRPDGGFICGAAVGSAQGDFYLPLAHSEGNISLSKGISWLRAQAKKPSVTFCFHNAPYDLGWLKSQDIEPVNLPHDTQAMATLLDEYRLSYSLDALGLEFLGEGKADAAFRERCRLGGVKDPMAYMDLIPAWLVEPYALQDIHLTRGLFSLFRQRIIDQELQEIYQLERECCVLAVDMKAQGVKLDLDEIERTRGEFGLRREEYIKLVLDLTGINVDPNDHKSIIKALKAENAEIELPTTPSGKRESVARDALDELPSSPVVDAIRWMRQYDKAIGTTLNGLLSHQYKGRIHADFNPLRRSDETGSGGASTGRFSSSNPNLQNIPIRVPEIGVPIRRCFIPEHDCDWAKLDYASQEPRLTIHFAATMDLFKAWEMVFRFRADPYTDLHLETALLMFGHTHETWAMLDRRERRNLRQRAKVINLALAYGAGGANICDQLGLPTVWDEFEKDGKTIRYRKPGVTGEKLLQQHNKAVPFIRELQKIAKERASERGFVTTILGRRCRFRQFRGEYGRIHKALNSLIQGSAADQMKRALVLLRRQGILVPLSVHDEADISVPRGASAFIARIRQTMEEAVELLLPVIADVKLGDNWGAVSGD